MEPDRSIDLSVVIVNYNVRHFAEQCLNSVREASDGLTVEVWVVDNDSTDGSVEYLRPKFPEVHFIASQENLGFARANNLALKQAGGRYLLILNPDTLLGRDSLRAMIGYLDSHLDVGALGPKILTRYGQFDRASKRGLPTPWVSFCRLSGLGRFFPQSQIFGRYDLLYLDPERDADVDSLCGAAMMVRREAYNAVGGLDEAFFMYGEDIDWSYRFALAGWKVRYAPVTSIVHFRGESTRRSTFDRDRAFYGAMHLFVEKHFRGRYPWFSHKFLDLGIFIAEIASRLSKLWKRIGWGAIDFAAIWGVLTLGRFIRLGEVGLTPVVAGSLSLQAAVTIASLGFVGAYGVGRRGASALVKGAILAFLINSSFTYFFNQFAYSRIVNLFALGAGPLALWLWRLGLHGVKQSKSYRRFYRRRSLVVGVGETAREVVTLLKADRDAPYEVVGLVDPDGSAIGSLVEMTPVLGGTDELDRLVEVEEIEEVIFAYDQLDYNLIMQQIGKLGRNRSASFKIISSRESNPLELPPFLGVDYLFPRSLGGSIRKLTTLVLKR